MLLGLTGQKQSGKDTTADLVLELDFDLDRVLFAGPLKAMIRTLLLECGMTDEEAEDHINGSSKEVPLKCLQGNTTRKAMQTLGTEWRNMLGINLWSDIISGQLAKSDNHAVVTDMRFLHEESFLRDRKAHLARVLRYGQKASSDLHPSEQEMALIKVDSTIYNYGTLKDLETCVLLNFAVWSGLAADLEGSLDMAHVFL